MNSAWLKSCWIVFTKEVADALRDRRTLLRLLVPAVLMGPLLLFALSTLIASLEARAEKREVLVVGMDHAPSLRNYLERQTYTVTAAPADFEQQLRDNKLGDPVVVVPKDFEAALAKVDKSRPINVLVRRGEWAQYVLIRPAAK